MPLFQLLPRCLMFKISDYLYYRLLIQCYKQEWNDNPCSSAFLFLCAIQSLVVYCILMFIKPLIIPKEMVLNGKIVVFCIAAVMTSFYLFNYHRYKNRDEEIKEKYKDSKANKWFKLWMFPLIILLLYFLPFIVMGHTEYV